MLWVLVRILMSTYNIFVHEQSLLWVLVRILMSTHNISVHEQSLLWVLIRILASTHNIYFQALLMHGYVTFNMLVPGPRNCSVTRCVLPCPRTSIVRGYSVRATSVKRGNKIVQEIMRNAANAFTFYAIIAIEHGFSMH